jgi:hypothetical protein
MPGLDSEALDFRVGSESFAPVRALSRCDLSRRFGCRPGAKAARDVCGRLSVEAVFIGAIAYRV